MRSAGATTVTWDPSKAKDTDANRVIDDLELQKGIQGLREGTEVTPELEVNYLGDVYKWKDIKDAAQKAQSSKPGDNIDPTEFKKELAKLKLNEQIAEVQRRQKAVDDAKAGKGADGRPLTPAKKSEAIVETERALDAAKSELHRRLQQAQAANVSSHDSIVQTAKRLLGMSDGSGAGHFSASTMSTPSGGASPAGTGGAPGAGASSTPFRAMGFGAATADPYGAGLFEGLNPPSTPAFMRAMYNDSLISDGLGDIGRSRREGQRLMMLFFYFARMAESGDLGAMYQFIKFINYIIAKDKARQNIQISSKLIQLQDLSRKALDTLMATKSDDQNQNEFMKAMQKARSDEATISTSQKLLADMLQEFAHVVETLTNSVKNLLDAWGRVQRTASSR